MSRFAELTAALFNNVSPYTMILCIYKDYIFITTSKKPILLQGNCTEFIFPINFLKFVSHGSGIIINRWLI